MHINFIYNSWTIFYKKEDENIITIDAEELCHMTYAGYDIYTFKRNDNGIWELYQDKVLISTSKTQSTNPPLFREDWNDGRIDYPLQLLNESEGRLYFEKKSVEFGEYIQGVDPGYLSHDFDYESGQSEVIINTSSKNDLSCHISTFFKEWEYRENSIDDGPVYQHEYYFIPKRC